MEKPDCALVDREGRIVSYLAGTLPADEAEAFEAHYFGCDECWRELQQALEIRAAVMSGPRSSAGIHLPDTTPFATSASRQVPWRLLAAAATVALAAWVWQIVRPQTGSVERQAEPQTAVVRAPEVPSPPPAPTTPTTPRDAARATPPMAPPGRGTAPDDLTLRAPVTALRVQARFDRDRNLVMEWSAVDRAVRYVVAVFAADGTQILKREVETSTVTIEQGFFSKLTPDQRLFARVDAMNALGVAISTSARLELPARR